MKINPQKLFVLSLGILVSVSVNGTPLADRHASKSMDCLSCHITKPEPFAEVPATNCLKCHPKDAIVNKYTELKERNPHQNHLGDVDCNICHKGHAESSVYCEQCHQNFKLHIK